MSRECTPVVEYRIGFHKAIGSIPGMKKKKTGFQFPVTYAKSE